jgi:hypothetical protein
MACDSFGTAPIPPIATIVAVENPPSLLIHGTAFIWTIHHPVYTAPRHNSRFNRTPYFVFEQKIDWISLSCGNAISFKKIIIAGLYGSKIPHVTYSCCVFMHTTSKRKPGHRKRVLIRRSVQFNDISFSYDEQCQNPFCIGPSVRLDT